MRRMLDHVEKGKFATAQLTGLIDIHYPHANTSRYASAVRSAMIGQENWVVAYLLQSLLVGKRRAPENTSQRTSAISAALVPGKMHSGENIWRTSGNPPTGVTNAGVPEARDSRVIMPNPSNASVGTTETSAAL